MRTNFATQKPVFRPKKRRRIGSSCVEMAFVAPVFFVLIFGSIEIAFGYMVDHLIQNAAREGCRLAITMGKTNDAVKSKVDSLLQSVNIEGATTSVSVNYSISDVSTAKPGDQITVRITVPKSSASLFPVTGYLKGQMSTQCTLRHD